MSLVQRCTDENLHLSLFSIFSYFRLSPLTFALPSSFHSFRLRLFIPRLCFCLSSWSPSPSPFVYETYTTVTHLISLALHCFDSLPVLFHISVIEPISGQVPAKVITYTNQATSSILLFKMRFSVAAVLAIATAVFAQTDGFDVISNPYAGEKVLAGLPCEIKWAPSSDPKFQGTVRIDVLGGTTPQTLDKVGTVACE